MKRKCTALFITFIVLLLAPISIGRIGVKVNAKVTKDSVNQIILDICKTIAEENNSCLKRNEILAETFVYNYCIPSFKDTKCTTRDCLQSEICAKTIYGIKVKNNVSFCGGKGNSGVYCGETGDPGDSGGGNQENPPKDDNKNDPPKQNENNELILQACNETIKENEVQLRKVEAAGVTPETVLEICIDSLKKTTCSTLDCFKKEICGIKVGTIQVKNYLNHCKTPDPSGRPQQEENPFDNYNAANCYGFGDTVYYITMIVKILQIAAPILLILWASIDLVKSLTSNDEKTIIAKRKPIIQRFIAAALVFLVPSIVIWIVDGASINADEDSWLTCWKNNGFKYTSGKTSGELDEIEQKVHDGCASICKIVTDKKIKRSRCTSGCFSSYGNTCNNYNDTDLDTCINSYLENWYDYYKSK